MRRHYLVWSIAVFGIIGTVYGASNLIYNYKTGKGLYIPGLALLIFGVVALVTFLVLFLVSYISIKKKKKEPTPPVEEEVIEEKEAEPVKEEPKVESKPEPHQKEKVEFVQRTQRTSISSSSYSVSTIYVKQVGYGPLLRVEGNRILDMRTNTYYRIENNMVMQEGYGPVFEIRGTQIKNAYGGYLYELSSSNINKTFGGFYASVSGNYITLYDLSIKYEMTDSLSRSQLLAVAALLFGRY